MRKLYMLGITALLSLGLVACSSSGEDKDLNPNSDPQGVGVEPTQPSEQLEDPSLPTTGDGMEEESETPEIQEAEPQTDEPSTELEVAPEEPTTDDRTPADTQGH